MSWSQDSLSRLTMNDKNSLKAISPSGRSPLAACLLDIRKRLQEDKFGAMEIAAGAVPASSAKPELTESMLDLSVKHGADVLSASLDIILEELE